MKREAEEARENRRWIVADLDGQEGLGEGNGGELGQATLLGDEGRETQRGQARNELLRGGLVAVHAAVSAEGTKGKGPELP